MTKADVKKWREKGGIWRHKTTGTEMEDPQSQATPAKPEIQSFPELVEEVITRDFILECIKGTNLHGYWDEDYTEILSDEAGIFTMKMYICAMIKASMRTGAMRTIRDDDDTIGAKEIKPYISRDNFELIHKHFCLNAWDPVDLHPYKKFARGIEKLCRNSNTLINVPEILTIDEFRILSTSHKDKYKSFSPLKPTKIGRNCYNVCVQCGKFHGYTIANLLYSGDFTYDHTMAEYGTGEEYEPEEGKQDNKVNKLIFNTVESTDAVYVMDRGFTSINIASKMSEYYGHIGIVGTIDQRAKCLPKSYFASNDFPDADDWERGAYEMWRCGGEDDTGLNLTIIKDTKLVFILDNTINVATRSYIKRGGEKLLVPHSMKFYNRHMGEVDASASHREPFQMDRKSTRYNQRSIWSLLELYALINPSIVMAVQDEKREIPHIKYRAQLIEKWTREYREYLIEHDLWKADPIVVDDATRVKNTIVALGKRPAIHRQVKYDLDNTRRQKRCRQCYLSNRDESYSTFICDICTPCVAFCNPKTTNRTCFVDYHSNQYPDNHHSVPL